MSKKISQVELLAELSELERQGVSLASAWKTTTAAAADGDASRVNDVLELDACTNDMILTIKKLVVRMVKAGFEAEDDGFGRCLALLFTVAEMSVCFSEAVQAAKRVIELQAEVQAARGLH
jgi:cytoplasmic iron level regulating protein YaaA (DUF328/UPF0246 family)